MKLSVRANSPESFHVHSILFQDGIELDLEDIPYDGCRGYDSLSDTGLSQEEYLKERLTVLREVFSGSIKVIEHWSNGRAYKRWFSPASGMTTGTLFYNPFGKKTQIERFCKLYDSPSPEE